MLCERLDVQLYIIQGYDLALDSYNIMDEYKQDETYCLHEQGQDVPCLEFQIKLAERINREFLKMDLPLERFKR